MEEKNQETQEKITENIQEMPNIDSAIPRKMLERKTRKQLYEPVLRTIIYVGLVLIVSIVTYLITVRTMVGNSSDDALRGINALEQAVDKNAYYLGADGYFDKEKMVTAALKAYIDASNDPYAEYMTADEFAAFVSSNAGNSEGIGITVAACNVVIDGQKRGALQIVAVNENTPAAAAGLLTGEYIVSAFDAEADEWVTLPTTDTAGFTVAYYTVVNLIRQGEIGTSVQMTVLAQGGETAADIRELSVVREKVETKSVYWKISDADTSVGIVRLTEFNLNTPEQFKKAMNALTNKGITSFVLDLRGNPGGDLLSVKAIATYFLSAGNVIVTKVNRDGKDMTPYVAEAKKYTGSYAPCSVEKDEVGMYASYHFAVLVDNGTGSAAEILTSVFRDYQLGAVIGTTTYGKGIVQTYYSLAEYGFNGYVKLTSYGYLPASGISYHGIGIAPMDEYYVELSAEAKQYNVFLRPEAIDNQVQAAISYLKK